MTKPGPIRQPLVEGLFYPAQREELLPLLTVDPNGPGARALVLPHGGYSHILEHLQRAFAHAPARVPEVVVLIAGTHREPEEKIFYPQYEAFATPLGEVPLAHNIISRLKPPFYPDKMNHMEEFSLELLLPFVKHLYPESPTLPLLIGKNTMKVVKQGAKGLQGILPENTLFLLSTNLTPHQQNTHQWASKNSLYIQEGDLSSLMEDSRRAKQEPCGLGALLLADKLLPQGRWKAASQITTSSGNPKKKQEVHYQAFYFQEGE